MRPTKMRTIPATSEIHPGPPCVAPPSLCENEKIEAENQAPIDPAIITAPQTRSTTAPMPPLEVADLVRGDRRADVVVGKAVPGA
jgi:hypothetical protein